ncbi:hypothetical protein ACFL6M_01775 [Candidatus Eisenbacteria bacterium]|uniref:VCBS repeat-containing protein n=1 Tax=Eiseniibacteriota bacterium TaxID=2212470 RepID=A0ABV6YJE6_UNCEI
MRTSNVLQVLMLAAVATPLVAGLFSSGGAVSAHLYMAPKGAECCYPYGLGAHIAPAGDFNADGYADVLAGDRSARGARPLVRLLPRHQRSNDRG